MSMRWFKWMMPLIGLLLGGCGDTLTSADGTTGTVASIQLITSPATIGTNPVASSTIKTVTLQLDTESYDKGYRDADSIATSTLNAGFSSFGVFVLNGFLSCGNEDINLNGILDAPDVDVNGNGTLEPGIPATTTTSVTTDSSGNPVFDVVYPKDYADWVQVKITASVQVAGTESSNSPRFLLPMSSGDLSNPPGAVSRVRSVRTGQEAPAAIPTDAT